MFIAESETQRLRFIADVFGEAKIDALKPEQKNMTAEDIIIHLCTNEKNGYGIDLKKLSKEEVLKLYDTIK